MAKEILIMTAIAATASIVSLAMAMILKILKSKKSEISKQNEFQLYEKQLKLVREEISEAMDSIEETYAVNEKPITGLITGFDELDKITTGLKETDLIILAARCGIGKTSFVLNLINKIAMGDGERQRVPVAIFSLEMSSFQVSQHMLCIESQIDLNRMKNGQLRGEDWAKLTGAASHLAEAPIFIDDTPNLDIKEIKSKSLILKNKHDIRLLVIDYLQLIHTTSKFDSEQQRISYLVRELKKIAHGLEITIILTSQLPREALSTTKTPCLSDLSQLGPVEREADLVIFLHRDLEKDEDEVITKVIIDKNDNGPTGIIEIFFNRKTMRFQTISSETSLFVNPTLRN